MARFCFSPQNISLNSANSPTFFVLGREREREETFLDHPLSFILAFNFPGAEREKAPEWFV